MESRELMGDDGIRVSGDGPPSAVSNGATTMTALATDELFADENPDMWTVCRPSARSASASAASSGQCQCEPTPAESREFRKRWLLLTEAERTASLRVDAAQFVQTMTELLPCLGCRNSTETLFQKLLSGARAPPVLVSQSGLCIDKASAMRLDDACMDNADATMALFLHHERFGNISLAKYSRSTRASARVRCPLHSQRSRGRPRPAAFEALWKKLSEDQQRHLSHIDSEQFLTDLENYLRRHRFCCRCKEKVLEAYDLLIGSSCSEDDCEDCAGFDCSDRHLDTGSDYGDELHYTSYLFDELTYSRTTSHIVVPCHIDFMSQLMSRADQEIVGDWGDRHARTIAEAQDEVLTCLGIVIWDKLQNLWTRSRTEKRSEELVVHCAVWTLRRNFDVAVEALHGKEMMEQLLAEEDDESRRLAKKKEKRKEKKKKRKNASKQRQTTERVTPEPSSTSSRQASPSEPRAAKKNVSPSVASTKSVISCSTNSNANSSQGSERDDSDNDDVKHTKNVPFSSDPSCDDDMPQVTLDEQMELQLLSSMGWNGSMNGCESLTEPTADSDDEQPGIPDHEIEFWKRNRSALVSKRLAQRQKLQEKFDQFVMRSATHAKV